jgi:hypothetical protein
MITKELSPTNKPGHSNLLQVFVNLGRWKKTRCCFHSGRFCLSESNDSILRSIREAAEMMLETKHFTDIQSLSCRFQIKQDCNYLNQPANYGSNMIKLAHV